MDFSWESLTSAISGVGSVATAYNNTRAAVNGGGSAAPAPVSSSTVNARSGGMSTATMAMIGVGGLLAVALVFKLANRG